MLLHDLTYTLRQLCVHHGFEAAGQSIDTQSKRDALPCILRDANVCVCISRANAGKHTSSYIENHGKNAPALELSVVLELLS